MSRRHDPYATSATFAPSSASTSAAASPAAPLHSSMRGREHWPAVPAVDAVVAEIASGAPSPPQRSSSNSSTDAHHHGDLVARGSGAPVVIAAPSGLMAGSGFHTPGAYSSDDSAAAADEQQTAHHPTAMLPQRQHSYHHHHYDSRSDSAAWPGANAADSELFAHHQQHSGSFDAMLDNGINSGAPSYAAAMYAQSMLMASYGGEGAAADGIHHHHHATTSYVVDEHGMAMEVYYDEHGNMLPAYERAIYDLARGGAQLPQNASSMINKIERKRRQRKRRVARRKERERERRAALAAAAAAGLDPPPEPHRCDDDSEGSSGSDDSSDDDDDKMDGKSVASRGGAAAAHLAAPRSRAAPAVNAAIAVGSDSDDDPFAREIPVLRSGAPTSSSIATLPVPRSMRVAVADETADSPATQMPRARAPSPPSVTPPLAPRTRTPSPVVVVERIAHDSAAHQPAAAAAAKKKPQPAKKKDEWQVVGGNKAAAVPPPKPKESSNTGSAATIGAAANPFAVLAGRAQGPAAPQPQVTTTKAHEKEKVAVPKQSTDAQKPTTAAATAKSGAKTTTAAAAPAKKRATSNDDDFEAVLLQLQHATSRRGDASSAGGAGDSKGKSGGGGNGKSGGGGGASSSVSFDGGVPIVELLAATSSPLAAAAAAALRKADSRRVPNSFARIAALAPLERCCATHGPGDKYVQLLARIELADICTELQDGDQAVLHATAAVDCAHAVGDATLQARAFLRLAKGHEATGDAPQAMEATRLALSVAGVDLARDPRFVAHCLACYGSVADLAGQPDVSMRCLDAAESLAVRAGDRRLMVDITGHKAASLLAHGSFDGAVAMLEPLLDPAVAAPSSSSPSSCAALVARDASLLLRVLPTLAQAYYTVGSAKWKPLLEAQADRLDDLGDEVSAATCYSLLAQLSRSDLCPKDSLAYTQRELRLLAAPQHQCRTCDALSAAGACYTMLGHCQRARMQHSHELENAHATGDGVAEAKALIGMGHADLADKDARSALKSAMRAMTLLDQVPLSQRARYIVRVACYETEWKALDLLEAVHLQLGNIPFAARVADHKHVAELQPLLLQRPSSSASSPATAASASVGSSMLHAQPRLAAVLRPSDAIAKAAAAGVDLMISYSFAWNDAATTLNIYAIEPATNAHHSVSVDFPVRTMALLAADNSRYRRGVSLAPVDTILLMHRLGRLVEIAARGELREDLEGIPFPAEDGGVPDRWLAWMYEDLIGPVAARLDALRPNSRVVFIADGFFSAVPFGALRPTPDRPCLINRFVVTTAPSVAVLGRLLERTAKPRETAALVRAESDAASLAKALRGGAECRVAHVDWRVGLDTVEPFIGGVFTPPSSAIATASGDVIPPALVDAIGTDGQRVNMADIVASAAGPAPSTNSTAVLTGMIGTTNRIGHDVSIPPHFAVFLVGYARTLRPLYPAAVPVAQRLAAELTWDGAEPSADSFRQVCLKLQASGNAEWHGLLLAGAL